MTVNSQNCVCMHACVRACLCDDAKATVYMPCSTNPERQEMGEVSTQTMMRTGVAS